MHIGSSWYINFEFEPRSFCKWGKSEKESDYLLKKKKWFSVIFDIVFVVVIQLKIIVQTSNLHLILILPLSMRGKIFKTF